MFSDADGHIYWFEKHFSPKMYELICQYSDGNNVSKILLLTGTAHIDEGVRNEFKRLQEELGGKEIFISHRVIVDKKILNRLHGRWFISSSSIFKIPPIDTILQGQADEIILRKEDPGFSEWWDQALDIVDDWNKIKK